MSEEADLLVQNQKGEYLGGGSRLVLNPSAHTISTKVVSIDDTVPKERPFSLIHLDVERFEQQALEGALSTIRTWKPILILENLPEAEWMNENLFSIGYQKRQVINGNTVFTANPIA